MINIRTISVAALAVFASVAMAQNGPEIHVVVDGNPIIFGDQQPAESNGRVLVPLRGVFEKLGASVDWDPSTQSIFAHTRSTRVKLGIGQLDASVNDQPVHMDVPATLVGGTTMVPLRFVSEALGAFVTWNAAAQEVDIKSKVDYNFPPDRDHSHDRDRRPPQQQPPIVVHPVPIPQPRPQVVIMTADSVIPFVLDTRLNSGNAQPGDQFTAHIETYGKGDYYGLPLGSVVVGQVNFVHKQRDGEPGVLELGFDHIQLPNGRNIRLNAQLFDMTGSGAVRLPNGAMAAPGVPHNDHAAFTGYGTGAGVVVGFNFKGQLGDVSIGGIVGRSVRREVRQRHASNVELRPGTLFAIRLYSDIRLR